MDASLRNASFDRGRNVTVLRLGIALPGTNHIDAAQWNPLFYVFRNYFGDAVSARRSGPSIEG
jgi:hypothetical protein